MNIHIGEVIERKFQESGIKMQAFAEKINTVERNVYDIFKRKDIKADLLRLISEALGYNFFELYTQDFPKELQNQDANSHTSINVVGKYQLTFGITQNGMVNFKKFNDEIVAISNKYEMKIL